jgi:hypothetical protein
MGAVALGAGLVTREEVLSSAETGVEVPMGRECANRLLARYPKLGIGLDAWSPLMWNIVKGFDFLGIDGSKPSIVEYARGMEKSHGI